MRFLPFMQLVERINYMTLAKILSCYIKRSKISIYYMCTHQIIYQYLLAKCILFLFSAILWFITYVWESTWWYSGGYIAIGGCITLDNFSLWSRATAPLCNLDLLLLSIFRWTSLILLFNSVNICWCFSSSFKRLFLAEIVSFIDEGRGSNPN